MKAIDLRDFPPVEPVEPRPETLRQTFLRHVDVCPRSGYLTLKYKGGAGSHPLDRGTAYHRYRQRFTETLIEQGENTMPPELSKDILNEVIRSSTDLTLPASEQDDLREMAYHTAMGAWIDPDKVLGVEIPVSLEIGGWTITGTIDFASIDRSVIVVDDYKTSWQMEPGNDYEGSFQPTLYALMLAFGKIEGAPFDLGHVDTFNLNLVYPRYFWEQEGVMAYRQAIVTRVQLLDFRFYMENLVAKVEKALDDWKWPAVPGSHCNQCPAPWECPIPPQHRKLRGAIRSPEQAARAAEQHYLRGKQNEDLWNAIKDFMQGYGRPLRFGRDQILEWTDIESTKRQGSQDDLAFDIQRAVEYGVPFPWDQRFKSSISTRLKRRTLTPHELAEESDDA